MEISVFDENAAPFSAEVTLSAEETTALVGDAYARLARIFKRSESEIRDYAKQLMTTREIQTFLTETVMARAGERALATLGVVFVGMPVMDATANFSEGAPFSFRATAHPLPTMSLDLETPIARRPGKKPQRMEGRPADVRSANDETPDMPGPDTYATHETETMPSGEHPEKESSFDDEELVAETLRARLNGIIPDALLRDALARKKEEFLSELDEKGITYREYRIAHGVKPQDVQDALYDEAFDELSRDIALDTVFVSQRLETTADDERRILGEMAPGRESALRSELEATGKLWMLSQKTRRSVALRWAVEHLLEK